MSVRYIEHEGCRVWFVADDLGMPISFGYLSREEAEGVEQLIDDSDGMALIPLGINVEKILDDYR